MPLYRWRQSVACKTPIHYGIDDQFYSIEWLHSGHGGSLLQLDFSKRNCLHTPCLCIHLVPLCSCLCFLCKSICFFFFFLTDWCYTVCFNSAVYFFIIPFELLIICELNWIPHTLTHTLSMPHSQAHIVFTFFEFYLHLPIESMNLHNPWRLNYIVLIYR